MSVRRLYERSYALSRQVGNKLGAAKEDDQSTAHLALLRSIVRLAPDDPARDRLLGHARDLWHSLVRATDGGRDALGLKQHILIVRRVFGGDAVMHHGDFHAQLRIRSFPVTTRAEADATICAISSR